MTEIPIQMNEIAPHQAPALPEPTQHRWQPLRLGLIELFHYDSEEFWFRDGHLLLRGNNGTGKSKVLSLTLPFLFDAQLKSSRIEPDGDPTKKMAWNLLLGKHERRIGYTWLEFGRRGDDGRVHYLTLGCGLSAVAARPTVDSWFFILDERRIGQDLWLTSPHKMVLTKDRLQETINASGHGQVFDTAASYRRAVDERLFHLGQTRYAALMDTLIQLRQPQLSKRPDEGNLSEALTEALPPLPNDLLGDVADALNQLEDYRQQLDEYDALAKAISQFNKRYRVYAGTRARREARTLRRAQTDFDNASHVLNEAKAALEKATHDETSHRQRRDLLNIEIQRGRVRLEELQADPVMRNANRLDETKRNAADRRRDAAIAAKTLDDAEKKLQRENDILRQREARAKQAKESLANACYRAASPIERCGIAQEFAETAAPLTDGDSLAQLPEAVFRDFQQQLRDLASKRRDQLAVVQRRLREVEAAELQHRQAQEQRDERADERDDAAARRQEADRNFDRQGAALVDAWQRHFDALAQLHLANPDIALTDLSDWVSHLTGDNPARNALHAAQQQASERLAHRAAALNQRQKELSGESKELHAERHRLEQGEDATPPAPYFRNAELRHDRPGAPLWQLVEFRTSDQANPSQRAGLEAALEASGLLDAWVTPDGGLHASSDGAPFQDTFLVARTPQKDSLANWLQPAERAGVPIAIVNQLLESIACAETEIRDAEVWISPSGHFRAGPAQGFWSKPAATYIGYAARAAARQRRLEEIALRMAEIDASLDALREEQDELDRNREQAATEWKGAPTDDALRAAHGNAAVCARAWITTQGKLEHAEASLTAAEQHWRSARDHLTNDAADLRLPIGKAALDAIEIALQAFNDVLQQIFLATQEVRHALPDLNEQRQREAEVRQETEQRRGELTERSAQADAAEERWKTLYETVGIKVDELRQRLEDTRNMVTQNERDLNDTQEKLRLAGEARARAEQKLEDSAVTLEERRNQRQRAICTLQEFTASGLMAIAASNMDLPDVGAPWSIDQALNLARRAEQTLSDIKAEDEDWTRIQNHTSADYTELQRSLGALGHQAQAETSDYGLIVSVIYQNRPQRPDRLEAELAKEIVQRRELLTAREREVLENHLQAEVATVIQKMLQDAERHVAEINAELDKHPTSTGVRFRLNWEPLPEGSEGAPVGLDAARRRLLNTSADAWSPEDRQVVGEMLQSRIAGERAGADGESGGSLLEQLSRALDYRRWHRFRVKRWQDGQWRPLSGPASSGERALGLTVPLFAAVSSHYSHGDYRDAPRLVLLDEAFAGIDDAARAHCMALIREFDLDFVMTSEREWACYAELPSVSICQLQRREGIDAVYVSRWSWDGRARRKEAEPDRRFPEAAL